MPLYEDGNGNPFAWDERIAPYIAGIEVTIDGSTYLTVGKCVEERKPAAPLRRWVAIRAITSSGAPLSRTRLIDERGVPGLRQQVERAQHLSGH